MRKGFTLIELLVVMAIMAILGSAIVAFFININKESEEEIQKNELVKRANRIATYLTWELREAGFGISATPRLPDGSILKIGTTEYTYSIIPNYNSNGNDSITIIKAISFTPKLKVSSNVTAGNTNVSLSRSPESYEIDPNNTYKKFIVFENHKKIYQVSNVQSSSLILSQGLSENVPKNTEVFGLRVINIYANNGQLLYSDGITNSVIDEGVDGFKIVYILKDGSEVSNPANPANIRGIKFYLLLRTLRTSKKYTDTKTYRLGNLTLGPFNDKYRRLMVENTVEVKNVGY